MPLIPQIISFFNASSLALNNPVFKSRYNKALLMLESEHKTLLMKTNDDYANLSKLPLKFAILNVVKMVEERSPMPLVHKLKELRKKPLQLQTINADIDYLLMNEEGELQSNVL